MNALFHRVRSKLLPEMGSGGRARFVLATTLMAGLLWLILATRYASDERDDGGMVFLFVIGASAILGYLLHFAFVLFCWVLNGYDELGQRQLLRFALLMLALSAIIFFANMFRYETIDWHRDSNTCWSMTRDRWTNNLTTQTIPCPPKPERNGKVVPV